MIGFCLHPDHQDDVAIDVNGRCVLHHERTLPPSTACVHVRWINGAWTECRAPEASMNGQGRPCKPVAAGTWRNAYDRRVAPTPVESEQSAATKRFGHGTAIPTVRTAHKTKREARVDSPCPVCTQLFTPKALGQGKRQQTCSIMCGTKLRSRQDALVTQATRMRAARAAKRGDRWGPGYDACVEHGGTDSPYRASGLCRRCYRKRYPKPNRKVVS
jgi:hypothetical protein